LGTGLKLCGFLLFNGLLAHLKFNVLFDRNYSESLLPFLQSDQQT
jgi:hypothetical protein